MNLFFLQGFQKGSAGVRDKGTVEGCRYIQLFTAMSAFLEDLRRSFDFLCGPGQNGLLRGIFVRDNEIDLVVPDEAIDNVFICLNCQHRAFIAGFLPHQMPAQFGHGEKGLCVKHSGSAQSREFAVAVPGNCLWFDAKIFQNVEES